jgi:hypothetical protein
LTSIIDRIARPDDRLIMVVGNYGSGKTEVSVNLALHLARAGRRVQIADLDLVNPYFRCREARALMESHGIRVVVPPGAQAFADLPILLPEIRGMLHPPAGTVTLFDVGGDDVGARALATFRTDLAEGEYELWQVVNANRPFTDTVGGCLRMLEEIERASRLKVTALLANAHLIEETTPATVRAGWRLAADVARHAALPLRFVAAMEEIATELADLDAPVLPMRRALLPPWLRPSNETPLPAARPIPLGRPGGEIHGTHRD